MAMDILHEQDQQASVYGHPLVLPLTALDASMLSLVGGKAANLGELIRAGFAVPAGFCVTTTGYTLVSTGAGLDPLVAELAAQPLDDPTHQAELAEAIRSAIIQAPLPSAVFTAIADAYRALGEGQPIPVAVRSSATAEDLPTASFAGQQDTSLNMIGIEDVLAAVQRCWASLWTDRAIGYRTRLGIDPRSVRLAVVVQCMVDAQVAGVLFTANPLTGKRRQAIIDATPGLGEALVSGLTNPDHFVVDTPTGAIVERHLGDKQVVIQPTRDGGTDRVERVAQREAACISDAHIYTLATIGVRVEAHFGLPQDIEWAIDRAGDIFLVQARPITTLFPLPPDAPLTDANLQVYLSFNVQQGTARPFTPMGISALRLITSGFAAFVGYPPADRLVGPRIVVDAACRFFFDVTTALRTSFGRALLIQMMEQAEVHAAAIFRQLAADPRLALVPVRRWPFVRAIGLLLIRSRLPWYLLQALLAPRAAQARVQRLVERLRIARQAELHADASGRLAAVERILFYDTPRLLFKVSPVMLAGMQAFSVAAWLLGDCATESDCQAVLRGSPSNPTTAMNLALWALAEHLRADPPTARLIRETPVAQLAAAYHAGRLPPVVQHALAAFLVTYGHQAVAELDLGVPRWAEDPTYMLGVLASYLQVHDPVQASDVQFQRVAEAAEAMVHELTRCAAQASWWRGRLVGFCLSRARLLSGFREMPRFVLALLLAQARAQLASVGTVLAEAGRLEHAEDIFFLTLPEVHAALAGTDTRSVISERRADYTQERSRRHVPLVLLSDGTEPSVALHTSASAQGMLQGTPASPGVVTGAARVIHDPEGARLEPGEILVAPTTDPGWTPLFLTAAGLVMEMGGAMAHGAIVAREYGLPAVVGVAGATERISTGTRITVDGAAGTIVIEQSTDV